MKLIRLTHSVSEKRILIDFDKVTDIIENKKHTVVWKDTHAITVKESAEQINKKLARKLAKQAKEN